jgi:hypothetical protein
MDAGVQPAWNTSLYCSSKSSPCAVCGSSVVLSKIAGVDGIECHTSYHNNYSVTQGQRTYYPGVPKFIQVGEHQFVETRVVSHWRALMLYGW